MGKCFCSHDLNQALLLPPSLHDWLPEKHLARFLVDVLEMLDLGVIYASYEAKDARGQAAYAPEMMLRLLLYGYCVGVCSSRKIETKTYEDVAFRYLSADQHPDHDTIAEFRKRHLDALAGLFKQALLLCEKAIVERVFGQIKDRRGFRHFSLRGLTHVQAEWKLVCATANLLKLFRYGGLPAAA